MFRVKIEEHGVIGQLEVRAEVDVVGPWYSGANLEGAAEMNRAAQVLSERLEETIRQVILNFKNP
jgi:hypothetical protein